MVFTPNSSTRFFLKARNAAGYENGLGLCSSSLLTPCDGVGWTRIGILNNSTQEASGKHLHVKVSDSIKGVMHDMAWLVETLYYLRRQRVTTPPK